MIRFACPACGKIYKAEDELAGRKTACKACEAIVVIPQRPVQEVLYGTALPPEEMVDATPESKPEPQPKSPAQSRDYFGFDSGWANDHDEFDDDWEPRSSSRRKLGKVTAIGGMLIGGGAWALLANLLSILIFPLWCFWPGLYFGIVWAIFAIIRGSGLLGDRWYRHNPRTIVILQIVQAVNLDIVNIAMGIIGLVFLNERPIRASFRSGNW